MTYCVAMNLASGMLFASDSRTNAGVDHVSTFRKMQLFERPGERLLVLLSAGNLATTQSVVSLLRQRAREERESGHILNVPSLYEAACLVGETLREIAHRDGPALSQSHIEVGCSFLLGGQIKGEAPRLFNIYPQGNFIESTTDTPYFQIGEAKYGKPIIDRVIQHHTPVEDAAKCALISFDSTMKSNLSVGLPIDMLLYGRDALDGGTHKRITEHDAYFQSLHEGWGRALREAFAELPPMSWDK
ncbi:proteasome-type protease [uncultured Aquitalea sp.]|uniref:proteasome-type protease n=1 Tax=uncultured Aquitalea sp. TaxID=540272 RepID=UPI0025F92261|nr:proteasome-type protease [uncultured Aquitalea sp.]